MVSVCVATYNGEKYIREQLQSILCQLGADDEVVLSDDGSTDGTLKIVEGFHDERIRILRSNAHSCKWNFCNAIEHARGNIIFLSDQDDVWLDGKVERCVKELETCDLVVTNSIETDANLNCINPSFFSVYHSGSGIIKNSLNNTYYGSCMAFRQSMAERAFPMPKTKEIGHDLWLGLVAEMTGKVRFIETPYMLYRRHEGTVTKTTSLLRRSKRNLMIKIWSRVVVLYNVIKYKIIHD